MWSTIFFQRMRICSISTFEMFLILMKNIRPGKNGFIIQLQTTEKPRLFQEPKQTIFEGFCNGSIVFSCFPCFMKNEVVLLKLLFFFHFLDNKYKNWVISTPSCCCFWCCFTWFVYLLFFFFIFFFILFVCLCVLFSKNPGFLKNW